MRRWTLLTALALSAGCAQTAPQSPPSAGPPGLPAAQPSITTSASIIPAGALHLTNVNAVAITVSVAGAPAIPELAAEFREPGGVPYQKMTASVPDSTQGPQAVTFTLPVAGTFIDTLGRSGTWIAHLFVNGQERTVQPFELAP